MTKFYIVRHTETTGNIEKRLTGRHDYELTLSGIEAVTKLTNHLKDIKFDKVYASTSGRTQKTIAKLAEISNKEIIILEELCEMDFGIYDGWKWEDVNKANPKIKQIQNEINEITGIPNQECMEEVACRMYECIKKIAKENENKTILICSHGVAIEAFLRKIVNLPFRYEREKYCQHNTAINLVEYENEKFCVKILASMKHLEE